MRTVKHVILLLIDDLRADQFQTLLKDGQLPNIQQLTGTYSNSTACFPAITYPAQSTILTGCYPDAYGFPGGHWVKRAEKTIRNYNSYKELDTVNEELGPTKTLFELIDGPTGALSIGLTRGIDHYYPTRKQIIGLYIWHWLIWHRDMGILNKLVMNKLLDYFNKPRKFFGDEPPRFAVAWFISSDNFLHNFGSNSEKYLSNLKDIDTRIGHLLNGKGRRKGLKELGYLDDTVILLLSDHGNYAARNWVDVAPHLERIGLSPLIPTVQDGNFDATMGGLGFFTLRGETWMDRPTIAQMQAYGPHGRDLFKALLDLPGVQFLYYREDGNTHEKGEIHVLRKHESGINQAVIEYNGDLTKYIAEGKDIFGYSNDETAMKVVDHRFHTIEEWLEHTHQVDFPMLVDQAARLFRNPHSCDIMISTCGETIFTMNTGELKMITCMVMI